MKKYGVLMLAGALVCILAGCGGGGGGSWTVLSGNGTLTSSDQLLYGSFPIDFLTITAPTTGTVEIALNAGTSNGVSDPYLLGFGGTVRTAAEAQQQIALGNYVSDDDSGVGLNSLLLVNVQAGQTYTLGFTCYHAGTTGNYSWRIEYTTGGYSVSAAEAGDKPASANGLAPGMEPK